MDHFTIEAITTALVAALAVMARAALRFARSPEGRIILRVLAKHGMTAALDARAEFAHQMKQARAIESDGGVAITPAERKALAQSTCAAFVHALDVAGLFDVAVSAFGGADKMEDELIKSIEAKIEKAAGG